MPTPPALDASKINQVILELHRAGHNVACGQFQPCAMALIQEVIAFDSAWWGHASSEPLEILSLYLHNCHDSILETYTPYMEQDFFRTELMARPGTTINLADLITRERFIKTALYEQVGKRYKVEWSLGTLQMEPISGLNEFLTVWRHDGTKPFTEAERQAKELLMPHLAEAHRAMRLRQVLGDVRERGSAWAVTDARGYLRETSAEFVHCIRAQWPDWRGSLLPQPLLEPIGAASGVNIAGLKIHITRRGEFRYLRVQPFNAMDKLTAREQDIASRFARGDTYAEIATALALSPATVRNHLAHCYQKLGVNNKAELTLRVLRAAADK